MSRWKTAVILATFGGGVAVGMLAMLLVNGSDGPAGAVVATAALCSEHGVPETECTRCNPELIPQFKARGDWCAEHNLPESQCDLCGGSAPADEHHARDEESTAPDHRAVAAENSSFSVFFPANEAGCATDKAIIQLASVRTAERAGLSVETAIAAPVADVVEAPAEVEFDESRTRTASTTVSTTVVRWLADPGQQVMEGQALAELESPEMPALKAEFVEATGYFHVQEQDRVRKEQLYRDEVVSAADYQSSVAAAQAAQARLTRAQGLLQAAGLSAEELVALRTQPRIDASFILRSPANGVVAKRLAKPGDLVPAGTPLAIVSDPESLWVEAQVRERDLSRIRVGHDLEFIADGSGITRAAGRVTWVANFLDPETRTGTVRARIVSPSGRVRPGEFGRARILIGTEAPAVLIPRDAVQWEGCCNVVFVQETADRFRPRKVQVAPADNHHYRATSGLQPGERVVVQGSFLLKTELKKGSLGVGCAGDDAET